MCIRGRFGLFLHVRGAFANIVSVLLTSYSNPIRFGLGYVANVFDLLMSLVADIIRCLIVRMLFAANGSATNECNES